MYNKSPNKSPNKSSNKSSNKSPNKSQNKSPNKSYKKSKMHEGTNIKKNDIMYQDNLVCILKPDVKKGIIVWTHYTTRSN